LPTGQASTASAARKRARRPQADAVISEFLGADQREDEIGEQDHGDERAESVEDFEADHDASPLPVLPAWPAFGGFGPSSLFSPTTMAATTTQSASKALIQTMSIQLLLERNTRPSVSADARKNGEQSRWGRIKKA
jgi:hypothetical protein